ncbi:MAG: hypothetical protein QXO00_04035 [Candidatus Bathyarchaeia archaeon]
MEGFKGFCGGAGFVLTLMTQEVDFRGCKEGSFPFNWTGERVGGINLKSPLALLLLTTKINGVFVFSSAIGGLKPLRAVFIFSKSISDPLNLLVISWLSPQWKKFTVKATKKKRVSQIVLFLMQLIPIFFASP